MIVRDTLDIILAMRNKGTLLFFLLLVLAGCRSADVSLQTSALQRTRPADCVPLPPTLTPDLRPRTPTPNRTQLADPAFPTPFQASVTPIPIARSVDLSPSLPDRDKMVVRIYRCDGSWNEYRLDPALFPDAIPFAYGDILYSGDAPASIVGKRPPEPWTATASPGKP